MRSARLQKINMIMRKRLSVPMNARLSFSPGFSDGVQDQAVASASDEEGHRGKKVTKGTFKDHIQLSESLICWVLRLYLFESSLKKIAVT